MRELFLKVDKEIGYMDKISKIGIPIFLFLIIVMPFVLTRELGVIDLSKNGDIGSNIGGITAPFIGILSAFLIYISFKAQIKANRIQLEAIVTQIEKTKNDDDLKFIYLRLSELQNLNNNKFKECLLYINVLIQDIEHILIYSKVDKEMNIHSEIDKKIIEKIENKRLELISVKRYLNIISVIERKINEIKSSIDSTQSDYIFSVLRFEFYTMAEPYFKNYTLKIEEFRRYGIIVADSELDKLSLLCNRVQKFII